MKTIEFPVDETHSPILIYDEETLEILEANQPALNLYGYEKKEMERLRIKDLVPDDDKSDLDSYLEREKEFKHTSIWRNLTKQGEIIYVRIQANFVKYKGREARLSIVHDITEGIRSHRKYELEHELLKSLMDKLPGIYLLLDDNRKILRWNYKLEELTGYSKDQIQGATPFEFVNKNKQKDLNKAIEQAERGEDIAFEIELDTGDERVPLFVNLTRINDGNSDFLQAVGLDISELKKVEMKLRSANEDKETMLGEIHHRVKNNLAIITGMLELQSMEDQTPALVDGLNDAILRIKSIASVHEMLYQSKSFTTINFSKNLKRIAENIEQTLDAEQNIDIRYDLKTVNLNVNNAMPLANLANELISNAFKHAFKEQAEGRVQIRLTEDKQQVKLEIEDDGMGLPKDVQWDEIKGMGFSIIESLVKQLGAQLTIDESDGTCFRVTFDKNKNRKGSVTRISQGQLSGM